MKKLLEKVLLHKTILISASVFTIVTASIIAVVLIENNHKKEKTISSIPNDTETVSSDIKSDSEVVSENEEILPVIEVDINSIPKEETEIKPSTGSVLTAPEFSYKPEEDTSNNKVNSDKFAPQTPPVTNTVNPNVKKVEPTDNNVNVRVDAGTNFKSLGKVKKGEVFDYLGEKIGTDNIIWYNISGNIDGKQQSGYIRSDYAKYVEETIETPSPADNYRFEQKEGKTYCYKNDQLLKGYADINGLRYYFNTQTGAKESYTCIDVSRYQKNINWASVKAAGIEYAIIRVGFRGYETGRLSIDPYFEQNIIGAKAAGIKCGVYFYSVAKDMAEAVEEANFVLNAVKDYNLDLPIAIDIEHYGDRVINLNAVERTDNAIAFMETIKQAGYKTMLYTYYNYYNNHLEKSRLLNYTLWMAYYTNNSSLLSNIIYDGWQYASNGTVSGIDGNCDMNVIFESMISGNKQENPLANKKEESTPETGNEDTSSTDSEVTSSSSSETSSSTNSEVTSSENSATTSSSSSETSSENTGTAIQNN